MESSGLRELLLLICCFSGIVECGDQTVRGIVGGSVTLKVNTSGLQEDSSVLWTWGPVSQETVITESFNGDSRTDFLEKFRSRLQLDRATGSLTITDLHVNDSGLYQVQAVREIFQSRFILTVYGPVSKPEVRKTPAGRALVTQNCSLLCSVQNGREVTLSCYREREEKPLSHTSSPDLHSTLTLPLETEGQYNNTYSCVASNPVSRQTTTVNTSERCRNRDNKNHSNSDQSRHYAVPAICSVVGVLAVIGAVAYLKRHRDKQREGSAIYQNWAQVNTRATSC